MSLGKRIFLCGFMGCGKSTHGKKLASVFKTPFVDLDNYIQKHENKTIQFIFDNEGEDEFRRLETKYLQQVINENNTAVISLGGGTVCFNNNIDTIKQNGILIYIEMPAAALAQRLKNSKQKRPLLNGLMPEEYETFIEKRLTDRNPYYRQAHIITNGISLNYLQLQNLIETHKP